MDLKRGWAVWMLVAAALAWTGGAPAAGEIMPRAFSPVPSLDELQSLLLDTEQIAQMPTLHNFHDTAVCATDVFGVYYRPGGELRAGSGPRWSRYDSPPLALLLLNDLPLEADICRWYPYQALRVKHVEGVAYENTVRLVFEGRGLMYQLEVCNRGPKDKTLNLAIQVPYDETTVTQRHETLAGYYDAPHRQAVTYAFVDKPDRMEPVENSIRAYFNVEVKSGSKKVIRMLQAVEENPAQAQAEALRLSRAFVEIWRQTRERWAERWRQAFTPGNPHFSGNFPTLVTNNMRMRESYYRSILTLMMLERTNLAASRRVFVTAGERAPGWVSLRETARFPTLLALVEPREMRRQLGVMMQCDPRRAGVVDMRDGRQAEGPWDAVNDYSLFRLGWAWLGVTGEEGWREEPGSGPAALERLAELATNWKKLARPGEALADYGEAKNLLECAPAYAGRVASLNAANAWMMRRTADLAERRGDAKRAEELRAEAQRAAQAVLGLYEPGQGVWAAVQGGGRVEQRHAFDYLTVGACLREDLGEPMKREMNDFVGRELFLNNWMRAMSLDDPAAERSDRPDYGPLGAADALAAMTIGTMCELGGARRAMTFYNQSQAVLAEGVYAQAHELFGPKRFEAASGARIAQRGVTAREWSGGAAFAEMIVATLFGYRPEPGERDVKLLDPQTPRMFEGKLMHVRRGGEYYTITAGAGGVRIEKEPAAGGTGGK